MASQFIDIAVASGYAAVCLSLIVLVNPIAAREAAVGAASSSTLDSATLAYIERVGFPFFETSPDAALCASAIDASNSTVVFDLLLQGVPCDVAAPPHYSHYSSLTLTLPGRTVVVEAWLERQ